MPHPRPELAYILVDDATGEIVSMQGVPHGGSGMLSIPPGHTEYTPNEASYTGYDGGDITYDDATNNVVHDPLATRKAEAKRLVDNETEQRILVDRFEYPAASGKEFSLTLNAQVKWNGVVNAINAGLLDASTDPVTVKTHDDLDEHTFNDNASLLAAWAEAYTTIQSRLAANRTAKDDVDAAATEAAVDQVVTDFLATP